MLDMLLCEEINQEAQSSGPKAHYALLFYFGLSVCRDIKFPN